MSFVSWQRENSVAVVNMENGENRHNPDFLNDFFKCLDEIEADEKTKAVVIKSSDEKNWSLGLDLDWIMQVLSNPDRHIELVKFMLDLNKLYVRVLTYPLPVIAAICGHVFGGGAILACACDFRFMRSEHGYFCFPEINLGLPFLPGMWAIVSKALPAYLARETALTGRKVDAFELHEHQAISKVYSENHLVMEEAVAYAKSFSKKRSTFAEMKRRMNREVIEVIETLDPPLIEALKLLA